MAVYMSDDDRNAVYVLAIDYIKQAQALNNQVKRMRVNAGKSDKSFGGTGVELSAILATAADLDARAQAALATIDNRAQPVADMRDGSCTSIVLDDTAHTITFVVADADYTDFPSGGKVTLTGSALGNDKTYDVSRSSNVLTIDQTPDILANETLPLRGRLTWIDA